MPAPLPPLILRSSVCACSALCAQPTLLVSRCAPASVSGTRRSPHDDDGDETVRDVSGEFVLSTRLFLVLASVLAIMMMISRLFSFPFLLQFLSLTPCTGEGERITMCKHRLALASAPGLLP